MSADRGRAPPRRASGGPSRADVAAALEGFAAGRRVLARRWRCVPLAAGVRNRVARVLAADVDWIVRLGGDVRALGADRRAEALAHAAAAAAGLAPPLVHVAPRRGLLVTTTVVAPPWSFRRARSADGIAAIARRLRELHALPPPAGLPEASVAARLSPGAGVSERPRVAVLCHRDPHHRNVLGGAAPLLVDWEYAALGDPAFDLAAWACYHDFDAARRAALRAAYGGIGAARLELACRLFDRLQARWYARAGAWHVLPAARRTALRARLASDGDCEADAQVP